MGGRAEGLRPLFRRLLRHGRQAGPGGRVQDDRRLAGAVERGGRRPEGAPLHPPHEVVRQGRVPRERSAGARRNVRRVRLQTHLQVVQRRHGHLGGGELPRHGLHLVLPHGERGDPVHDLHFLHRHQGPVFHRPVRLCVRPAQGDGEARLRPRFHHLPDPDPRPPRAQQGERRPAASG